MTTAAQDVSVAQNFVTAHVAVAQIIDTVTQSEFPQMQTSSLAMASQLYMWEPANPTERADFEEDLIASTNENNYQQPLSCKQILSYQGRCVEGGEASFLVSSLFEAELERGRPFEDMEGNSNSGDDFELDLEMNDLLDDFVGHNTSFVSDIHQDMDIFAENHSGNNCNCCGNSAGGKKKNACHDYAMDSTFISFECEQKQQLLQETSVMAPHFLEHTFDNMSQHESSNQGLLSDLLRDKEMGGSRSRFISDETMFGNLNDIPDKSFDKEEEESKEQSLPTISSLIAPVELLGIPLDNEVDEDVTNIKLSPYIQKDNSLPMLWPLNPFSDSDCRLNFDQTENLKLDKFADEINCEESKCCPS